jgi:hypothetical protein
MNNKIKIKKKVVLGISKSLGVIIKTVHAMVWMSAPHPQGTSSKSLAPSMVLLDLWRWAGSYARSIGL